mmetsp:Transcript_12123/g.37939  ORF Transcript_12123/g.37939 Transcript_12123/m.37939 type:complete len:331 (-) Transcript_12123:76-1068(-)
MGEPIKMRIREGCRGGSEQFTWNSLKEQEFKDRECYLGQSTKIGMMGKFGRYYMHDWYARKRDTPESIDNERSAVKAYEEELMQEALGLKPKKLLLAKKQLTEEEMKELLTRDEDKNADKQGHAVMGPQKKVLTNNQGEQVATSNEEIVAVAAREAPINGIGFAAHRTAKLEEIKAKTLGTVGQLQGSGSQGPVAAEYVKLEVQVKAEPEAASSSSRPRVKKERSEVKEEPTEPSPKRQRGDSSEERRWRKAVKKEKKEKKEKKKEKKRRKAEKKLRKAEKKLRKQEQRERTARAEEQRELAKRKAAKNARRGTSTGSGSSSSGAEDSSS